MLTTAYFGLEKQYPYCNNDICNALFRNGKGEKHDISLTGKSPEGREPSLNWKLGSDSGSASG